MYNRGMDPKTERLNLRLSAEDDRMLRRAAEVQHTNVSEFVIRNARLAAEHVLADRTLFSLDEERWTEFVVRLEQPPVRKPELAALLAEPDLFE